MASKKVAPKIETDVDAEVIRKIITKLEIRRDAAQSELEEVEAAIENLESALSAMEQL